MIRKCKLSENLVNDKMSAISALVYNWKWKLRKFSYIERAISGNKHKSMFHPLYNTLILFYYLAIPLFMEEIVSSDKKEGVCPTAIPTPNFKNKYLLEQLLYRLFINVGERGGILYGNTGNKNLNLNIYIKDSQLNNSIISSYKTGDF